MNGLVDGWRGGKAGTGFECEKTIALKCEKTRALEGWMGGWISGKAGLRIAYSNKK